MDGRKWTKINFGVMLSEKDLIFLGAVLIWTSPVFPGDVDKAVIKSQEIFDKVFNSETTDEE